MSNERDPRVDPRPGDVVRDPVSGLEMTVVGIRPDTDIDGQLTTDQPWVQFTWRYTGKRDGSGGVGESAIEAWLNDWAKWEIVKVAE
jgi:hypothetical protein